MSLTKLQLSELLSTYGSLLTQKQRDVVAMFCDCDCTLSEIAAEHGISRQGVRDTIVKSEATLAKFEESLHLAKLMHDVRFALQQGNEQQAVQLVQKFVEKE